MSEEKGRPIRLSDWTFSVKGKHPKIIVSKEIIVTAGINDVEKLKNSTYDIKNALIRHYKRKYKEDFLMTHIPVDIKIHEEIIGYTAYKKLDN